MSDGFERMLRNDEPEDRRVAALPRPAVNLAARVTQLARQRRHSLVEVRLLILDSQWYLLVDGRMERLGEDD